MFGHWKIRPLRDFMKLKVKANCQGILGTLDALRKQATKILIKERSAIEDSPLIPQALRAMILDENVQHRAIIIRNTRKVGSSV